MTLDLGITGNVSVGSGLSVSDNSKVGDVAMFKDNTFVLSMSDRAAFEKNRMMKLTDEFKSGLSKALEKEPLVVFFDAVRRCLLILPSGSGVSSCSLWPRDRSDELRSCCVDA